MLTGTELDFSQLNSRHPMHAKTNTPFLFFLAATAALGGMMFGFDLAIIVGAGPFLVEHFSLGDLGLGWAYSSLLFGCVLGSVLAGNLTDRYGRRRLLLIVALLFFATSIATGVAPTFTLFIVARFLGGLAVGGVSVLSPMYIAEVAPPQFRGRMGATYQLSITAGILGSYCINFWLRNQGAWNWRWMFISGALPSAVFFISLLFAPETPRFLLLHGRKQEGLALLTRLVGSQEADREALFIEQHLSEASSTGIPLLQGYLRRVIGISIGLAILVQVSGINTIIDYTPLVLRSAGWQIDAQLFSTFIIGSVNFAFTLISLWTIDRFGRKPLYLVGSLGMAVSLLAVVGMISTNHYTGVALLLCMAGFIAFFAACIGPAFWTVLPEIFPNSVRGRAVTIPVVTQWVVNAVVVLLFPLGFNRAGKLPTFAFLAGMALLQAWFAWKFLPETKGKSLEEIEAHWIRTHSSTRSASTSIV